LTSVKQNLKEVTLMLQGARYYLLKANKTALDNSYSLLSSEILQAIGETQKLESEINGITDNFT